MGVKMEVGKPIDNNRVEVNATYDGISRKKFSVPKEKADEFVSTYKKKYRNATILNTATATAAYTKFAVSNI